MASADLALHKGLPLNLDAERFVLGSIMMDDSLFVQVAGVLQAEDFALEKRKELIAREIHYSSRRASGPFVEEAYAAPPPPNPEEPLPSETKEDASWESIAFEGGGTCVAGLGAGTALRRGRWAAP